MAEFDRAVIVGVGLLGGSAGLALRKTGLAKRVVGFGRSAAALQEALNCGAIDQAAEDIRAACEGADLAIVCTPVQQIVEIARACFAHMPAGGLITDVGSTKYRICQGLASDAATSFCGSHPLAGSDKSGVAFANQDLFVDRLTIITPTDETPPWLVARTESLWQGLGSQTLRMSPLEHDRAVAKTSHLPHVVAAALAAGTPDELLPLAASGWCDTTRVAAGGPELWRQILEENRSPVLAALELYADSLQAWIAALRDGDGSRLEQLLQAGKLKRDSVGN